MIEEIQKNLSGYNFEIIIVDDNSPDMTWKICREQNDPAIKVIKRTNSKGLASAILRGIIESSGDIIIWLDTDMLNCPEHFPQMVDMLMECDVVVGSRYVEGGNDERDRLRCLTSIWLNGFATLLLGYGIRDYDSGFIACRRSVFDTVIIKQEGYGEYCIRFIYLCCKRGLNVKEMPYSLIDRSSGDSKSFPNFFHFLMLGCEYGFEIIKTKFVK